ncbi:hypothetical protein Bca52824_056639 [Brassica carinata]|uniref:RNase H type-1 domain-containing protein n=1 Tax=Brassica carinata TaxID=52824 RepID=A0A8X7QP54_BRACI|nr:hypothetical protein Bca52824_056639 [Brassica carinata]
MNSTALCPRCKKVETAMHVFFQCPFAKEVWRFIPLKSPIRIEEEADFKTLMVKAREMICLPPTGIRAPVLPWICWYLWLTRNILIFEDKSAQPSEVATKCLSAALEWNQAQTSDFSKESKVVPVRLPLRQAPRQNHTICCFVDAAWEASSKRAGTAWRFTNEQLGFFSSGTCIIDNVSSPLMAESLALRKGITEAMKLELPSVAFLSDCATLIRAISIPNQLKEIYGVFDSITFNHISRSQNSDADFLAKQALKAHVLSLCLPMD